MQEHIPTLAECSKAKKSLAVALHHSFQSLSVYGKEPEALESMVFIFNLTLSEYTWHQIENAFKFYWKHYKGFPEPSDIVNIIERNGKPPLERSVYVSIMKKNPDERTKDEWRYIDEYQNFIINGEK